MKNTVLNLFILVAMLVTYPALAEEMTNSPMPDEAAMQKAMELSMPGEGHKVLEQLAGDWTYTMTHKMAAAAPEMASEGTSKNEWILDGRFLRQEVNSQIDMGGQMMSYHGIGTIGYDNMKKEYMSTWMDNMSTGMMVSTAQYDPASKTLKESGTFSCPMKGTQVSFTSELKFIDGNHFTYTMYQEENGQKYKSMDISYTRKQLN